MGRRQFVVAGNAQEFKNFCRERKEHPTLGKYVFVNSPRKLLSGRGDAEFHFIGTFYERSDFYEIQQEIRARFPDAKTNLTESKAHA